MNNWDLSKLYDSYDSKEFLEDIEEVDEFLKKFNEFKDIFSSKQNPAIVLENYLSLEIEVFQLIGNVSSFISLNSSTNTTDKESAKYGVILSKKLTEFKEVSTMFSNYVSNIENLDEIINSNDFLKQHNFAIKRIVELNKYTLDKETEGLLAKLSQSSSSLWNKL